jgi:hypothetical protein
MWLAAITFAAASHIISGIAVFVYTFTGTCLASSARTAGCGGCGDAERSLDRTPGEIGGGGGGR